MSNRLYKVSFLVKEVGEGENQLPSELAEKQLETLEIFCQAIKNEAWLVEINDIVISNKNETLNIKLLLL